MLLVPMKTHLTRIAAAALLAALAVPVAAQDGRAPSAEDLARLEVRVAALEARVAEFEAEEADSPPGSEAMDRVAQLADRAVARLVGMVRELKRDLTDKEL